MEYIDGPNPRALIKAAAAQERELTDPKTESGVVKGKLSYMPPEQLRARPLDGRVDVYALGVVLPVGKPVTAQQVALVIQQAVPKPTLPPPTPPAGSLVAPRVVSQTRSAAPTTHLDRLRVDAASLPAPAPARPRAPLASRRSKRLLLVGAVLLPVTILGQLDANVQALELLGDIVETVTQFADVLGEVLSADGPEYALSADAPEEELPPDPPPMTADGRVIPQANDKRPEGDKRSADQIVNDSPPLAHLGRQKDIKFDQLCKQTGVDPDLNVRDAKQDPDAVYRLSKVLEFIDASPDCEGNDRPGQVKDGKGDGNIERITKSGDARDGTEAGMVKDFAEQGYDFLQSQATLPTTKDTHVNKDGSNKDNFQWGSGEAAKKLAFIPGVSNVLSEIGCSKGGVEGVLKGAVDGAVHTVSDRVEGALKKGRINPILLGLDMYKSELSGGTETPEFVKDLVDQLP